MVLLVNWRIDMTGKIRYIWTDDNSIERISKYPPVDACRAIMGGVYTPRYRQVVLIEVADD